MATTYQKIDERIHLVQLMANNALSTPEIKARLNASGYPDEKLQNGLTLADESAALVRETALAEGKQYQATDEVETAIAAAYAKYVATLKIARVAFRENTVAAEALMLNGPRRKDLPGRRIQMETFYGNLVEQPDFMTVMADFGYDRERIDGEKALVDQVAAIDRLQEKAKGETAESREKRNAKVKEMDRWESDFSKIARIVLADNPEWLEKLGL